MISEIGGLLIDIDIIEAISRPKCVSDIYKVWVWSHNHTYVMEFYNAQEAEEAYKELSEKWMYERGNRK